ncbi:MAG: hypothetical protein WCI30_01500 [Clostridia bacterium]
MFNKPICKMLEDLQNASKLRMHMPGHKGRLSSLPSTWDVTELGITDDLHQPNNSILASEVQLAKVYGSAEAHYLINGATCGIMATILALTRDDVEMALPLDAHRAFYNGLLLSGANASFLPARIVANDFIVLAKKEKLLADVSKRSSLVGLTAPGYMGYYYNTTPLILELQKLKKIVLLDSAHGSHLPLQQFDYELVADITIHSYHKTMGALTQTGGIHFKRKNLANKITNYLSILQSTSPSFLLLASIEQAIERWLENNIPCHKQLLLSAINSIEGFAVLPEQIDDLIQDQWKIVMQISSDITGYHVDKALQKKGIFVEMASAKHLLFWLSPLDTVEDYWFLVETLKDISLENKLSQFELDFSLKDYPAIEPLELSPKKVALAQQEFVLLAKSIGRIAAEHIIPYPFGIPLIYPGQRLNCGIINKLLELQVQNIRWQGWQRRNEKEILVIK